MRGAAGCVDSRATSAALGEQVESAVPREDRERVCSLSLPTCCIYVLATCTPAGRPAAVASLCHAKASALRGRFDRSKAASLPSCLVRTSGIRTSHSKPSTLTRLRNHQTKNFPSARAQYGVCVRAGLGYSFLCTLGSLAHVVPA